MSSTDRIVRTIQLNAPPARVWRALTDHREFGAWFQASLEGPFAVGKTTRGKITYPGYEHLVLEVVTVAMEPPRRFAFKWQPTAVDPALDHSAEPWTHVEFTLEKTSSGTSLVLTESGFDAIPVARRAEAFRRNEGGWNEQVRNIQRYVQEHP